MTKKKNAAAQPLALSAADVSDVFFTDGSELYMLNNRQDLGQMPGPSAGLAWHPGTKNFVSIDSTGLLYECPYDDLQSHNIFSQELQKTGDQFVGLAWSQGRLWTVGIDYAVGASILYCIDPVSGATEEVGALGSYNLINTFTADEQGNFWASDWNYAWYKIDGTNGTATPTTDPRAPQVQGNYQAILSKPDGAFVLGWTPDGQLWPVDTATGLRQVPPVTNTRGIWVAAMTFARLKE